MLNLNAYGSMRSTSKPKLASIEKRKHESIIEIYSNRDERA
jgi:predicted ATP-grasp superfamily ATP-dependent carboligase